MSMFYRVAYWVGFTPWEGGLAQGPVVEQISAMFDREEIGRQPPYGSALDLGCGSGIHAVKLAVRGWQVTGVDNVPRVLRAAHERARKAGVTVRFIEGDVTVLRGLNLGSGFRLLLDFGTVHGLNPAQRAEVGRDVSTLAAADATLLMLAFAPRHRGPLPRGMSRADIEAAYPGWKITNEDTTSGQLPWFLKRLGADPHWYRLRRK